MFEYSQKQIRFERAIKADPAALNDFIKNDLKDSINKRIFKLDSSITPLFRGAIGGKNRQYECTPLEYVCLKIIYGGIVKNHEQVLTALLENGADLCVRRQYAKCRNSMLLESLINESRNKSFGNTLVELAIKFKKLEMFEMDDNFSGYMNTPANLAAQMGHSTELLLKILENTSTKTLLQKNSYGIAPLHAIGFIRDKMAIKYLYKRGKKEKINFFDYQDNYGFTLKDYYLIEKEFPEYNRGIQTYQLLPTTTRTRTPPPLFHFMFATMPMETKRQANKSDSEIIELLRDDNKSIVESKKNLLTAYNDFMMQMYLTKKHINMTEKEKGDFHNILNMLYLTPIKLKITQNEYEKITEILNNLTKILKCLRDDKANFQQVYEPLLLTTIAYNKNGLDYLTLMSYLTSQNIDGLFKYINYRRSLLTETKIPEKHLKLFRNLLRKNIDHIKRNEIITQKNTENIRILDTLNYSLSKGDTISWDQLNIVKNSTKSESRNNNRLPKSSQKFFRQKNQQQKATEATNHLENLAERIYAYDHEAVNERSLKNRLFTYKSTYSNPIIEIQSYIRGKIIDRINDIDQRTDSGTTKTKIEKYRQFLANLIERHLGKIDAAAQTDEIKYTKCWNEFAMDLGKQYILLNYDSPGTVQNKINKMEFEEPSSHYSLNSI